MAQFTYMPFPSDVDEVSVQGVKFIAYEPVTIDDKAKADLILQLRRNKWFSEGEIDHDRHALWKKVRDAQKDAALHREYADALDKDPETDPSFVPNKHIAQAREQADGIVAAARAQADEILSRARKRAQIEAESVLARAKAKGDALLAAAKNAADAMGKAKEHADAIVAEAQSKMDDPHA